MPSISLPNSLAATKKNAGRSLLLLDHRHLDPDLCRQRYGFDSVFSRQVEGLAKKEDVIIAISTSGNSENVIRGVEKAREIGAQTIGLLGNQGGKLKDKVDLAIVVPSSNTARIQEAHITIGHIICEILDEDFD